MAPLSDGQLATLARYGGFSLEESKVAVAIMLAESGGDPAATNRNSNGSIDRGVFRDGGNGGLGEVVDLAAWRAAA